MEVCPTFFKGAMRLGLDRCECNNPGALKHPIESALQDLMDRKWVQETNLDEPQGIQEPRIKKLVRAVFQIKGGGPVGGGCRLKKSEPRPTNEKEGPKHCGLNSRLALGSAWLGAALK